MSVKTIVSSGAQYVNDEGGLMGITSKDGGKHWRICCRKNKLWIGYKQHLYNKALKIVYDSEIEAQGVLDSLARGFGWKGAGDYVR